jgi:hypothetical protein
MRKQPILAARPRLRRAGMLLLTLVMMGLPLHAAPLPGPDPLTRVAAQQISVEEIIAQHYRALGGDEHQSVQTMKTTGRSVVMGMEAPYTRYSKRPNKVLLEIHVQGMVGRQAFDGETAWWYMPFMGHPAPELMPNEMALSMVEGSDFDGALVHAQENGHEVALMGVEPVNGRDAYKLEMNMASGGTQTHWVDIETFFVTRVATTAGDATFSDYRLIEGHPIPAVIEMVGPYGDQIIYVDDVEFDVPVDDIAFRMQ